MAISNVLCKNNPSSNFVQKGETVTNHYHLWCESGEPTGGTAVAIDLGCNFQFFGKPTSYPRKPIGTLGIIDGKVCFTGDVDASAKAFVETVAKLFEEKAGLLEGVKKACAEMAAR